MSISVSTNKQTMTSHYDILHRALAYSIDRSLSACYACRVNNKRSVKKLVKRICEMIEFIRSNCRQFEDYIYSDARLLKSRCGAVVQELEKDHKEFHTLEVNMLKLCKQLQIYRSELSLGQLSELLEDYRSLMMHHLGTEQSLTQTIPDLLSSKELGEVQKKVDSNLSFRERMLGTKFVRNVADRKEMYAYLGEAKPSLPRAGLMRVTMGIASKVATVYVPLTSPRMSTLAAQ